MLTVRAASTRANRSGARKATSQRERRVLVNSASQEWKGGGRGCHGRAQRERWWRLGSLRERAGRSGRGEAWERLGLAPRGRSLGDWVSPCLGSGQAG